MYDVDLDRQIAQSKTEYLKQSIKSMKAMLSWVWAELISKEGKQVSKKMFWLIWLQVVLSIATPLIISRTIDGLAEKNSLLVISSLVSIFIVDLIVHLGLVRYQFHYREYALGFNSRKLFEHIAKRFFEKSLGTHLSHYQLLNESNIKKGRERVVTVENTLLFSGLETVINILVSYLVICGITISFGLWPVAIGTTIILVLYFLWSLYLNHQTLSVCIPLDKEWRALHRYFDERLEHVEKVSINCMENSETKTIIQKYDKVIKPDLKYWLWFIKQITYRGALTKTLLIVVISFVAFEVFIGNISLGIFVTLLMWIFALGDRLWRVGETEYEINYATPAIMAMKQALNLPVGLKTNGKPITLESGNSFRIVFDDVGFIYKNLSFVQEQNGHSVAIDSISFTIEPGEKVAIIGPSGAGKTTIMRLFLKYWDPDSGRILVNGKNLKNITKTSWLSQIGYIAQSPKVLDGSIRYNLLYGLDEKSQKNISDEQLWKIMRLMQTDFSGRLKANGLETVVGKNGIQLSGGEVQRLALCAAVIKNPWILLVDEATSSLDATTERKVQEGLARVLSRNLTAIIIAHRLSTVERICDKFIMVNSSGQGGFVEAISSNFNDLAKLSPTFKQMAADQKIVL